MNRRGLAGKSSRWRAAGLRVEWVATAIDDRVAIFEYLLERNPHAAVAVSEALVLAGDSL